MAELDEIRAFVQGVESGGFGSAARRLGISKSIVSRRVANLESALGGRLLSRTTRGVTPTEAGQEFKARAERILGELDEARDAVARHGAEIVGLLRLSLPLTFGLAYVAPLLAEMAIRHPGLRIEASYSDGFIDIVAGGFDAAIRLGTLEDSSLVARRIAPIHGLVVASPSYLARKGRPRSPADLTQHDLLIQSGGRASGHWRFRAGRRWISVRPEGRFRADNGEALLQAAVAGVGIAVLPDFLAAGAVASVALEPLLTDYRLPEAGLYVVRPPGPHVPGKVRALIDLMVERFGNCPR